MHGYDAPLLRTIENARPEIHDRAWVAPTAVLAGSVTLHAEANVWYHVVLRGDLDTITVGPGSNIQDGTVVHADPDLPVTTGAGVSIGHRAVLHGCTVEDDSLVGMGSVVLNGAVIGAGSLVAAGAIVLEGTEIPAGSLVAGVPAKVRRELTAEERATTQHNAGEYRSLAAIHAKSPG